MKIQIAPIKINYNNNMKKILSLIAVLAFITPILTSCSSDDGEGYDFVKNSSFDTSLLFGRWEVEYQNEPKNGFWSKISDIRLTFNTDGTFSSKFSYRDWEHGYEIDDFIYEGEYEIDGEVITLKLSPTITLEISYVDGYDVYFTAKYCSDEENYPTVRCKGRKM